MTGIASGGAPREGSLVSFAVLFFLRLKPPEILLVDFRFIRAALLDLTETGMLALDYYLLICSPASIAAYSYSSI